MASECTASSTDMQITSILANGVPWTGGDLVAPNGSLVTITVNYSARVTCNRYRGGDGTCIVCMYYYCQQDEILRATSFQARLIAACGDFATATFTRDFVIGAAGLPGGGFTQAPGTTLTYLFGGYLIQADRSNNCDRAGPQLSPVGQSVRISFA